MTTSTTLSVLNTPTLTCSQDLTPIAEAFFARRSPKTREAYKRALEDFARWMMAPDGIKAILGLLAASQGGANLKVMEYMADLRKRGLSPSTLNQRLAALKSMIKLARQAGLIAWALDVEAEKAEAYRDTRGPGILAVQSILKTLAASHKPKAVRDYAIFRTLFDLGLRRAELCSLNLDHLDLTHRKLSIIGKGRAYREFLTLPEPTATALTRWIEVRGAAPGPLFCNLDRAHKGDGHLTPDGLYKLVRSKGAAQGVKIRPHGIRHTAITRVGELTNGNTAAMAGFSRHKKLDVLRRYMDNLNDLQGETAALLAGTV